MKLRKNSLKPLRFDRSGAIDAAFGLEERDIAAAIPELEAVRQELGARVAGTAAGSADGGFIGLPERLLREYLEDRQSSDLGRIFRRANHMQSFADRVVVLGAGGSTFGARAIMDACCQPYWNELSRGDRGSKPRMYFGGDSFDNDAAQSLLYLLGAHRDHIATDELERWGLIAISKNGEALETSVAFRQFLNALERSVGGDRSQLADLIVSVTQEGSSLHAMAESAGAKDHLPIPTGIGERFSVFSSVGLLPAALIGVNVIELLQGAAWMTDHFFTAPAHENLVLQYVSVNHLLATKRGIDQRVLSAWSNSLASFGRWNDLLWSESLGKDGRGATPITAINSGDLYTRHQLHACGPANKLINNVILDEYRFDALPIGLRLETTPGLNGISEMALPELMRTSMELTNQSLHACGRPTTTLHVPCLDELHLGQLLQMMMLCAVVEAEWAGIDPWNQPEFDALQTQISRSLRYP